MKVRFWHLLTPPHYTNLQNSMISFDYSWFLAKNLSNFVFLPWKLHNRYCHTPRSQFALGSNGNGAFRASGFGTNLRKTPQNIDLSPSTSGSPIFSDQMQQLTKSNGTSNDRLFQSQLKPNTNILLVGESQYYPRTTDRADV